MLVRGVGPSIPGSIAELADPQISLHAIGETTAMASNNDWGTATNAGEISTLSAQVGATGFTANSKDAALLLMLEPGVYTAVLSGLTPRAASVSSRFTKLPKPAPSVWL